MRIEMNWERPNARALQTDGRILGCTVNKAEDNTIINIRGVIGDEWDGITARGLVDEVQIIDTPITLKLNTPGGLVDDALEIYDALSQHPHHVRADIVAQAWSAGTIITSAADEVRISPAAKFGIHSAYSGFVVVGNSREIREQIPQLEFYAESLEKLDLQIANMLSQRSNAEASQVLEWMIGPDGVDGTEFVGQEAVDVGFADSLIVSAKAQHNYVDNERANSLRLLKVKARAKIS